jgi:hypothetical protein
MAAASLKGNTLSYRGNSRTVDRCYGSGERTGCPQDGLGRAPMPRGGESGPNVPTGHRGGVAGMPRGEGTGQEGSQAGGSS